jgi:hypothetical protein
VNRTAAAPRRAAKEQSPAHVSAQRGGHLRVDAELADVCDAVAQPAVREAVEMQRAARLAPSLRLQRRKMTQIAV